MKSSKMSCFVELKIAVCGWDRKLDPYNVQMAVLLLQEEKGGLFPWMPNELI